MIGPRSTTRAQQNFEKEGPTKASEKHLEIRREQLTAPDNYISKNKI